MWDASWDANRGPSNWPLWRKTSDDPHLLESADNGGGATLGLDGTIGGGTDLYRITDYDLHYAPSVVIGKNQQPWQEWCVGHEPRHDPARPQRPAR